MIDFGHEYTFNERMAEPEWLVTNGIGGYASGSISGRLNSRYHGLLIAALKPPLGRTLMLSKFDETVNYDGHGYSLTSNAVRSAAERSPHLLRFSFEGTIPTWTFACADALLEKRVWMEYGANITYIRYTVTRASSDLLLALRPLVNCRDSHQNTHGVNWSPQIDLAGGTLAVRLHEDAQTLYLHLDSAWYLPQLEILSDYYLALEEARGLDWFDDHLSLGLIQAKLAVGESLTLVAGVVPLTDVDGASAYDRYCARENSLLVHSGLATEPQWIQRLVLAADQFVVARPLVDGGSGLTVLAGYPWFSDWGRDTMIALPGLTLVTRRFDVAANILRTFARFVDRGMLPNRFPDEGEAPEYNTVDATLWYFEAVRQYIDATNDLVLLRELYPILTEIIAWHERGTRFNIHVDAADGLLYAGEPNVQLTWMDVKLHTRYLPVESLRAFPETLWLPAFIALLQMLGVETPNWVVTPRIGKQVEINALWYNALRCLSLFAVKLGFDSNDYAQKADRVRAGYIRFWNAAGNCCYDVIDTPNGAPDATLRPNQLFAVALPHSPLTPEQQRHVVEACARKLVTPFGLRSLSPDHPDYQGTFRGNLVMRDSAYHQGTVWSWLIGAFVAAHLRVYGDKAAARSYLRAFEQHLQDHGLGTISEVFNGDAPHFPGGCLAQAWGVGEVLRAWLLCRDVL